MTNQDGEIAGDLTVLINRLGTLLTSVDGPIVGLPRLIEVLSKLDDLRPWFRDALVRQRKARGISQRGIADAMHTTQSWISAAEAVGYSPSWKTLGQYMRALDMEP